MNLALAADLDDIHRKSVDAKRMMEALLEAATPDHAALGKQRMVIARLGRERLRLLSGRIIPALASGPTPAHVAAARMLELRLTALFAKTTRHIGTWGNAEISADWPGYVAATRTLLAHVETLMTDERKAYPLLATLARAA